MDQLLECTAILTECMSSHFAESEQKLFSLPMDPSATNSVQECQQLLIKEEENKLHHVSKRAAGKSSGSSGSKVSQVRPISRVHTGSNSMNPVEIESRFTIQTR